MLKKLLASTLYRKILVFTCVFAITSVIIARQSYNDYDIQPILEESNKWLNMSGQGNLELDFLNTNENDFQYDLESIDSVATGFISYHEEQDRDIPYAKIIKKDDNSYSPEQDKEPVKLKKVIKILADEQKEAEILGFVYSPNIPLSKELQEFTYKKCEENNIDYELILAVMWRESRFTVNALNVNKNGTQDSGLMQINDINRTWLKNELGVTDLMDPYENITAGTAFLGILNERYGEHNALIAYQYGEAGMKKKLKSGFTTNKQIELLYEMREHYTKILENA